MKFGRYWMEIFIPLQDCSWSCKPSVMFSSCFCSSAVHRTILEYMVSYSLDCDTECPVLQGVVTPIHTILRAATMVTACDHVTMMLNCQWPYVCDKSATSVTFGGILVSHTHTTPTTTVYRVTILISALNTVLIGVTTPCTLYHIRNVSVANIPESRALNNERYKNKSTRVQTLEW